MPRASFVDLRERATAAVTDGCSLVEAAQRVMGDYRTYGRVCAVRAMTS